MSIWARIQDSATRFGLKVNNDGSTIVEISAKPPLSEDQVELPFQSFFLNQEGSSEMNLNPTQGADDLFCVNSLPNKDIFLTHLTIILSGPGAALEKFGNIAELTNGLDFFYESISGKSIVAQPLVRNLDFFRASTGGDGFGSGQEAFRAEIQGGQSNLTYLPKFDLKNLYGLTHGLRLRAGSQDRMCFNINDDLSLISEFNAQVYGKLR